MVKKKKLPKVSKLKRSVKDFLFDEDGFVSKETVLKTGVAAIAGLGILSTDSFAGNVHNNNEAHDNAWQCHGVTLSPDPTQYPDEGCYSPVMTQWPDTNQDHHTNLPNHSNHNSHSSGGWC